MATEEQAILIGANTALADNPSLTVRDWTGKNPIRFVIDRLEKLANDLVVFNNEAETFSITENNIDFTKPIAKQIGVFLHNNDIQSIIIEGGAQTLQTFIDENIWDEARVFTGKTTFTEGTKAPDFSGELLKETSILNDTLRIYKNTL